MVINSYAFTAFYDENDELDKNLQGTCFIQNETKKMFIGSAKGTISITFDI